MAEQGRDYRDKNYAINQALQEWLERKIVDSGDLALVHPVEPVAAEESPSDDLPSKDDSLVRVNRVHLRSGGAVISVDDVPQIVKRYNFFENCHNL